MGRAGTYTDGFIVGGYSTDFVASTEYWNGTTWTELSDLATAKSGLGSAGSSSASFVANGAISPGRLNTSEEWETPPVTQAKLREGLLFLSGGTALKGFGKAAGIPAGTWGSGGALNTKRGRAGFASNAVSTTTHIGMVFGGNFGPGSPGKTVNTEQYDGTSWSEVNEINTVRSGYGGAGTLTSALYAGGEIPVSPSNTDAHEQWNGSSWTETTEINTARRSNVSFGATNTDAITASGYTTTAVAITEQWNGSSWAEVADQNAAKYARGGAGTTTDGILFGGQNPTTNTETWNGAAWTEVSELNTAGEYRAASGSSSSQVLATGKYPTGANVEAWNGASWTEINDISTARFEGSGTGSALFGLIAGGHPGTPNNYATATEEFTVDNTLSTVTVS
jgi:hypothetical protein